MNGLLWFQGHWCCGLYRCHGDCMHCPCTCPGHWSTEHEYASSKQRKDRCFHSNSTLPYPELGSPTILLVFWTLIVSRKQSDPKPLWFSLPRTCSPHYTGQTGQLFVILLSPYPSCWSFQVPKCNNESKDPMPAVAVTGLTTLTEHKSHMGTCQCSTRYHAGKILQTSGSQQDLSGGWKTFLQVLHIRYPANQIFML